MRSKKTNIKIKHRKYSLYNKKRSKSRQVLTIVLTAAAACVLCVVGYGIGKPVMEYFQNRQQYTSEDSSDSLTPPVSDTGDSSETEDASSGESSAGSSDTSEPEPVQETGTMYILPEGAAFSSASLNSALAAAKDLGHEIVAVTMKDTKGLFMYKTDLAQIKNTASVTGSLTASQICDIITKAGFIPAAKISTTLDQSSPKLVGGSYEIQNEGSYYWMDNSPEKGGKLWLSPFKNETVSFIRNIAAELSAAGFKHIICANTMYPLFHNVDVKNYLSSLPLTDSAKRAEALWNVVEAARTGAEKNGAELWLEIDGNNILLENKNCTDAELVVDAEKLKTVKLIVDYSANNIAAAQVYKNAREFAGKISAAVNGTEFAVAIDGGFSGSARADAERAFSESEIRTFSE